MAGSDAGDWRHNLDDVDIVDIDAGRDATDRISL